VALCSTAPCEFQKTEKEQYPFLPIFQEVLSILNLARKCSTHRISKILLFYNSELFSLNVKPPPSFITLLKNTATDLPSKASKKGNRVTLPSNGWWYDVDQKAKDYIKRSNPIEVHQGNIAEGEANLDTTTLFPPRHREARYQQARMER